MKRASGTGAWTVVFVSLLILFSATARAEYFTIQHYDVEMTVNANAKITVREHIEVKFTQPRHGIIRKIPIRYHGMAPQGERADRPWGAGGEYDILLSTVDVEGRPFSTSRQGDYEQIKIGSADAYVDGVQSYDISYEIFGAINFFGDHSEFYWNVVGTEWDVPIEAASYTVHLPESVNLGEGDYFVATGGYGSRGKDASLSWDGRSLKGTSLRTLTPNEGITVLARFPAGALKNGSIFLKIQLLFANNPLLLLPVLVFMFCYLIWRKWGRDEVFSTAVAWQVPEGVTPTELGFVIDDKLSSTDLTSMIYHWAAHGLLKIEEVKSKVAFVFNSTDYILTKLAPLPSTAYEFEKELFNGLFGISDELYLSSLKNKFYVSMSAATRAFEKELGPKLYSRGSRGLGPVMIFFGLVGTFYLGGYSLIRGNVIGAIEVGVSLLIVIAFARVMPKKTMDGLKLYKLALGFKEFIDRVEKPRLEYILKTQPDYFDKTLPFAIVLGAGKKWAEKFEGLTLAAPTWYVGTGQFTPAHFNDSLGHSLSSMQSTFTSQPSQAGSGGSGFSSGGSSGGGGASGGGFGGGGGSSW